MLISRKSTFRPDLLLTFLLRQWLSENGEPPQDPSVTATLRALHADPQRQWTVPQLSAAVGMPPKALTRRFGEAVGQSPIAYFTSWWLAYGARLLRETTSSLATIADQVGYSTEFAFSNAFRREYGIAPGRFRDQPVRPTDVSRGAVR